MEENNYTNDDKDDLEYRCVYYNGKRQFLPEVLNC